jgi:ATP-dependent DNA helicase RecG
MEFVQKGGKYFDNETVVGAKLSDFDLEYVAKYIEKIGYIRGDAEFYLRHNNGFVTTDSDVDGEDKVSVAAILLFGVNPQKFFPRARLRFVRFEGKTAEVGERIMWLKIRNSPDAFLNRCRMQLLS